MKILLIDIVRTSLEEIWPSVEHSLGLMYEFAVRTYRRHVLSIEPKSTLPIGEKSKARSTTSPHPTPMAAARRTPSEAARVT